MMNRRLVNKVTSGGDDNNPLSVAIGIMLAIGLAIALFEYL